MTYYNRNNSISEVGPAIDISQKRENADWQSAPVQVLKSSSSVVIGIFPFQGHLIIVKMNGDILVVDEEQLKSETAQPLAKVYLPQAFAFSINSSSCNKTLEYAEFDPRTGTVYFTMASKAGILSTPLFREGIGAFFKSAASTPTGQLHVVLSLFAVPHQWDQDREFWGMAIDVDRRLLYCCNRRGRSSIGVWRLDDGCQLVDSGIPYDSWPYSFLQCCAFSRRNRALAVSSSPSQRILLFESCQEYEGARPLRFVSTIASKINRRYCDPVKFVINPLGMAFDSLGSLVVCDCGNSRLQIFSPNIEGDLTSLTGEWLSEKLWSSPRCVAIGFFDNLPAFFAGLHNGDVVCFTKISKP